MNIKIEKKTNQKMWYDTLNGEELCVQKISDNGDFIVEESISTDGIITIKSVKKEDAVISKHDLEDGWYLTVCPKCNTHIIRELISDYMSEEELKDMMFCEDCKEPVRLVPPIEMDASTLCDIIGSDLENINYHGITELPVNLYGVIRRIVKDEETVNKIFRAFYYEDVFGARGRMNWRQNKFIKTRLYDEE